MNKKLGSLLLLLFPIATSNSLQSSEYIEDAITDIEDVVSEYLPTSSEAQKDANIKLKETRNKASIDKDKVDLEATKKRN